MSLVPIAQKVLPFLLMAAGLQGEVAKASCIESESALVARRANGAGQVAFILSLGSRNKQKLFEVTFNRDKYGLLSFIVDSVAKESGPRSRSRGLQDLDRHLIAGALNPLVDQSLYQDRIAKHIYKLVNGDLDKILSQVNLWFRDAFDYSSPFNMYRKDFPALTELDIESRKRDLMDSEFKIRIVRSESTPSGSDLDKEKIRKILSGLRHSISIGDRTNAAKKLDKLKNELHLNKVDAYFYSQWKESILDPAPNQVVTLYRGFHDGFENGLEADVGYRDVRKDLLHLIDKHRGESKSRRTIFLSASERIEVARKFAGISGKLMMVKMDRRRLIQNWLDAALEDDDDDAAFEYEWLIPFGIFPDEVTYLNRAQAEKIEEEQRAYGDKSIQFSSAAQKSFLEKLISVP